MDDVSLRYFAVFGNPILHSRSPQLYNALFRHDRVGAYYTRINTQTGRGVCEIIRMLGLSGANITTPFKEEVIPFLDSLSPDAEKVSAVNTIINQDGELKGYNTDADGVTGSLREAGIDPAGLKCMVLGAGGAGKAAAMGLINAGADVLIANRTPGKALQFAEKAGCGFAVMEDALRRIPLFDVLVIALPPGIHLPGFEGIHPGHTIIDANYGHDKGSNGSMIYNCRVIRGERWLLHQAVDAYRLFTGKTADTRVMEEGLNKNTDPSNVIISAIRGRQDGLPALNEKCDMLIDGRGLDNSQIKKLTDEEKNRAFKGSG